MSPSQGRRRTAARRTRTETLGYLVIERGAGVQHESGMREDRGVLYAGHPATVFPSKDAAHAAIRHTIRYATAHGYGWRFADYDVMRAVRALRDARTGAGG